MCRISITITRLLFASAVFLLVRGRGIRRNDNKRIWGTIIKWKKDRSAAISLLEHQSSSIFELPKHRKIYGNEKASPDSLKDDRKVPSLENRIDEIAEYRFSRDNPSVDKLIGDTSGSGSGSGSENDDECSLGIDNCDTEAICIDTFSSFNCTCKTGFTGNGTYCERFVGIDVEVILQQNFKDAFNEKNSREYNEIENAIEVELAQRFRDVPKFKEINLVTLSRADHNKTRVGFVVVYTPSANKREEMEGLAKLLDFPLNVLLIGNISIEARTLEIKAPPLPPTNISFANVGDTEIVVTWTNPSFLKNFKNTSCYVIYQDLDKSEVGTVQVEPTQSSLLLENLQSDTFYEIFVRCQNQYGQSENSTSMTVQTENGKWYSTTIIIIIVIVIVGALFLFGLSIFLLCIKKRQEEKKEPGASGEDATEMQGKHSNLGYDGSLSGSQPKISMDRENNYLA